MRVVVLVGWGSSNVSVDVTSEEGCFVADGELLPRVAVTPPVTSWIGCVVLVDSVLVATDVSPAGTV